MNFSDKCDRRVFRKSNNFQVQKRLNFPYTVDEVSTNTAILFGFLAPQLEETRLWFLDSKYVGWVKRYVETSLRFDPFVVTLL